MRSFLLVTSLIFLAASLSAQQLPKRAVLSLNGIWQVEEGSKDKMPAQFKHSVQVPGLVSLASPPFKDAGPKVKDRNQLTQIDTLREAFWYRATFTLHRSIPPVAVLKIGKAMYGTKVFLNGKALGEHLPCFTPGYFDARMALKKGENVLTVRVGSCRSSLSDSIPTGFDFEKDRYIPGIYDEVEIILSSAPRILRVQTAPDVAHQQVRVQVAIDSKGKATNGNVQFVVAEAKSRRTVAQASGKAAYTGNNGICDIVIPIKDVHLWSPEDPFLYELIVRTAGDESSTRFGMREFRFDPSTKKALLNGKPYFMRGSNITLYRFFEDPQCKDLPWKASWVRDLHKSFKQFHWNSLRYCIGLAPEEWYRIADEEGILIQDEFPIWYGGPGWNVWPEGLHTGEIAREYTEWMQERWNHPSVVIWDASNETVCNNGKTDETADAVSLVRSLDLSHRPWDNSYSKRREPGDVFESHPYHFYDSKFKLSNLTSADSIPAGNVEKNDGQFPVVNNEYGWLWLNRDGSPTTLTKELYKNLLGDSSTVEQRRHVYAMYTAAETEFWRCHRQCAAVMHFTALGYSRPDGQTSDHFTDVASLTYDGEFLKYMPDAFSPVGLMLDEWGLPIRSDSTHQFRVVAINDLGEPWGGAVRVQILDGDKVAAQSSIQASLPAYGRTELLIPCNVPAISGTYTVIALLEIAGEKPVRSVREIPFRAKPSTN
jgi:beta-galactosidase